MAWLVIFGLMALVFYRDRRKSKEAARLITEAKARKAEAMRAEAEALREAAQIRAESAVRRGRPRKTTP